jgi:hypothetical protein
MRRHLRSNPDEVLATHAVSAFGTQAEQVRRGNVLLTADLRLLTIMEALNMKAVLYSAIFAILVSTPVLSADSVSLVGTWTGQRDRIAKVEGRRGGLATLVITEQQGNTFVGRLKRSNPTGDEDEPLWGAFTPGGKLMMGSDDEGTYIFSLIDQNTLDYCYSETGSSPRSVCARLTRQP